MIMRRGVPNTINFVLVLIFFLIISWHLDATANPFVDEPWPMFQKDASHTGYIPITIAPGTFRQKWERTIGTYDLNPVTVSYGKIFVSGKTYFNNFGLYALDATTGNTLWSKQFGEVFSVNPPSFAYGNVYIQTGKGIGSTADAPYLRAYKADTGELVFRKEFAAQWERYYAPTIYDGTIYINGGYNGGMYAFDAYTGTQKWFSDLPQYDQWTPAVDQNWAYAYLGENSPALYVLDRLTGELVFNIPDPDFNWNGWSMNLAPVVGGADDIIVIHDGRLISFDIANRNIRWQLAGNFSGQPSVANGIIYAIDSGALTARDQQTGNQLWAWELPADSINGTIIVTNSHLLVQTSSKVYAIDLNTHKDVWSATIPANSNLTISENFLYIAGAKGILKAIEFEQVTGPNIKLDYLMPFIPLLLLKDK